MALDFLGARAQFDNVKGGVVVEAHDGPKVVHIVIDQRALADLEGVSSTSPGALVSIYRSNLARIHKVAAVMYAAGEIDLKLGLRITSDRLNGVKRKG
jgi:Protein of unknown function (DUF1488)